MPNVNIQFLGQTLVIPGAYYADDVTATLPSNPALTPPLIFIGYGYGLKPMTPTTFVRAQDLLTALRGGPCSDFVQFLTNPSTAMNGANLVTYINCSSNTRSTLVLAGIVDPSTITAAIDLTSTNYGLPSNLLQVEVVAGSVSPGVNITIYDGYSGQSALGTNLGVPFQMAYTGAQTTVTYTVTASGTSNTIFAVSSPNSGESFTVLCGPGGYSTISDLVNYINGTGFYNAVVYSDPELPANQLDLAAAKPLPAPTGSTLHYVSVTAGLGDVIYWFNQFGQAFATAALHTGMTIPGTHARPIYIPFTHFSGAQSVPPLLADYAEALDIALTTPGWVTFIDSNDPGVIALGVQNSVLSATPGSNTWRRFVSGSSLGDSVSQAVLQAQAMNAYPAVYCYPGIYRNDSITGQNTLFSGLHVAAAAAGAMSGNIVALPLTNKSLVGTGVEVALTTSQINTLQQGGVMPLWVPNTTHVPTIISDLTTWQVDNNPENVFTQQVACRFGLAYSLQQGLAPYIGTIASPFGLATMKNTAISILNQLIYSPGNNGILVSWDTASLQLTYTGSTQTVNLRVNVVFVGQVRFILELVFVQPLSLAA